MSDLQKTSTSSMRKGLSSFVSPDKKFEENKKIGKRLVIFAWIVEIFAVLVGLSFALFTLLAGMDEVVSEGQIDRALIISAIMGALPLLAIAIVELTKIPMAQGFYRTTSRLWRALFGFAVFILCIVTFETMFNGMVSNFSVQTMTIKEIENKKASLVNEKNLLIQEQRRLDELNNVSINDNYQKALADSLDVYTKKNNENIKFNNGQLSIIAIEEQNLNNSINTTDINELEKEIESKKGIIQKQYNDKIQTINASYNAKIETIKNQRAALNSKFEAEMENPGETNSGIIGGIFGSDTAEEKIIEKNDNDTKNLNDKEDSALAEKILKSDEAEAERSEAITIIDNGLAVTLKNLKITEMRNQGFENNLKDIEQRKKDLNDQFKIQQEQSREVYESQNNNAEEKRQSELVDLKNIKPRKEAIVTDLAKIQGNIYSEDESYRKLIGKIQVYQIAKYACRDDKSTELIDECAVENISDEDKNFWALVWFISISLVVATMGVILALAGFALQDDDAFIKKEKRKDNKKIGLMTHVGRFLRRSTIAIWKRARKPKIKIKYVDKEVEKIVDKIVEKKVEVKVPVDKEIVKWKTRVVQVPLYSTQPGLVDLDPDILSKATIEKSNFTENKADDEEKDK